MENKITWLDIFVTERCNLKCQYCFHRQRPVDMTDETMEKAIDFLGERFKENIVFNFFGGEPLLRPDFCIRWMDTLRSKFPTCQFHISTNGTTYSKEFIDTAKKYNSLIQFSYDAIDQEEQRGCSEQVDKNIVRYVEEYAPLKIGARLTFTRKTVGHLAANLEKCYNIGIRKFTHHAELNNEWTDDELSEYEKQLALMYAFIADHKDMYMQFGDCEKILKQRDNSKCGAGHALLAVSADGNIYPCHRMVKMEEFNLGNVYGKKLDRGNFLNLKILGCSKCEALSTCHPCMAANYEFNGSLIEPIRATCIMNKIEQRMAEEKYAEENKDIADSAEILRMMLAVLSDVNSGNRKILETLSNEESFN